ncbi:MAG: hypothetical protein JXA51_01085 [Dehalococcoidales bacterium]|nr:hypothetical protein [Dehalococcoidales bacterium]
MDVIKLLGAGHYRITDISTGTVSGEKVGLIDPVTLKKYNNERKRIIREEY